MMTALLAKTTGEDYKALALKIAKEHRIILRWELDTYFTSLGYARPENASSRLIAFLKAKHGWVSRKTPTTKYLYCSPEVTDEEARRYCVTNGLVRKSDPRPNHHSRKKKRIDTGLHDPDTPFVVDEKWVGYTHLADYVKRAAEVCGVVQSKYWYNLPEWAGPNYIRGVV